MNPNLKYLQLFEDKFKSLKTLSRFGLLPDMPKEIRDYLAGPGTGDLDLTFTGIREIPEGFRIGGSLNLIGSRIKRLPDGPEIGGDLDLSSSGMEESPSDIKIGGNLELRGTKLQQLPDGLEIGGSLDLRASLIESLPSGLRVGHNLYLAGSDVTGLPDDLEVGGQIYGFYG